MSFFPMNPAHEIKMLTEELGQVYDSPSFTVGYLSSLIEHLPNGLKLTKKQQNMLGALLHDHRIATMTTGIEKIRKG